ncbi:helix-turn-helix domain-containing protein [Saccharopolyspora hirsuta]|uniref:PucR family transcriptional regulator n=1 Tax=Saccharopolyspora hirsuta TaxID=1837 RepID=UPI003319054D
MSATSTEIAQVQTLPRWLAGLLRPEVDDLAARILDEIRREIPELGPPVGPGRVGSLSCGVAESLHGFIERIARGSPQQRCEHAHRALGRNEMLAGRSLDGLHRAYRIGARLSLRRFMTVGERARIPRGTLTLLGEEIIAHVDALANSAVDGYLAAEVDLRALARHRRRLLGLLVDEPLAPAAALEEAAVAARWPLPPDVVVAVADRPVGEFEVPTGGLADLEAGEPCVLVPADAVVDWDSAFAGRRLVVTGPVALHDAPNALRWARRTSALVRQGLLPDRRVTWCGDHLPSVLLLSDEALVLELVERHLGRLMALDPDGWLPLAETLLWWIRGGGEVAAIAAGLGTTTGQVRERLDVLEPLYGQVLRDPDARFALEMALRAVVLLLGRAPAS